MELLTRKPAVPSLRQVAVPRAVSLTARVFSTRGDREVEVATADPREKRIFEITVRVPEGLKRELQDQAAFEDRTLTDIIRGILELHVYGFKAKREQLHELLDRRAASRGAE